MMLFQSSRRGQDADVCGSGISAALCYGLPPGTSLIDRVTTLGARHDNLHGLFEYFNYGTDRGTLVQDAARSAALRYRHGHVQ